MFKLDCDGMRLVNAHGVLEFLGNLFNSNAWDPDVIDLMSVVDDAESASDLFDDLSMMHLLRKPVRFVESERLVRVTFVDAFGNRSCLKINKI